MIEIPVQGADLTPPLVNLPDGAYKVEVVGATAVNEWDSLPVTVKVLSGEYKDQLARVFVGIALDGRFDLQKCDAWDAITGKPLGTHADAVERAKAQKALLQLDFLMEDGADLRYTLADKHFICSLTVSTYFKTNMYNQDVANNELQGIAPPDREEVTPENYKKYYSSSKVLKPFIENPVMADTSNASLGKPTRAPKADAPGIFNPNKVNTPSRLGNGDKKLPF
jgi:hypothetical protein